jgi:hypothetical protein
MASACFVGIPRSHTTNLAVVAGIAGALLATVKPDLTLTPGDDTVAREALGDTLEPTMKGDKKEPVFLRAGFLKVALVGIEKMQ